MECRKLRQQTSFLEAARESIAFTSKVICFQLFCELVALFVFYLYLSLEIDVECIRPA